MSSVVEGEPLVRIAAISDIHMTIENTEQYPGRSELRRGFSQANEVGAHILALVGDQGNRGDPTGVIQVGEDAAKCFPGFKVAISGNHDDPEAMKLLPGMGIEVLEKQTRIIEINGVKIGIYGQNGSLEHNVRESLRGMSWDDQMPFHHDYTRRAYHQDAVREIAALVKEGIDVLLVLSHVPLFGEQTSELENPRLTEMTPETGKFIDSLPVPLRIVVAGHTHSYWNRNIGRDKPFALTENNTVIANVASQNARRSNRPVVTTFDIYRLSDGELTVQYPIVSDSVVSQAS